MKRRIVLLLVSVCVLAGLVFGGVTLLRSSNSTEDTAQSGTCKDEYVTRMSQYLYSEGNFPDELGQLYNELVETNSTRSSPECVFISLQYHLQQEDQASAEEYLNLLPQDQDNVELSGSLGQFVVSRGALESQVNRLNGPSDEGDTFYFDGTILE